MRVIGLRAFVDTGLSAYRDLQSVTLDWTVIGFAIAVSLATALVFGILPALQLTLSLVVIALALVALLACYLPARRAVKVAPVVALRSE